MFVDTRLPTDIERGAVGGPRFSTTVLQLASGFEQRNQNWSRALGRWDIGYAIRSRSDLAPVIRFFYAMHGRAKSFRFRDWLDYQALTQEPIGRGDGSKTEFQLIKTYTAGTSSFERVITKPVSPIKVFNRFYGASGNPGSWTDITASVTINYSTGVLTTPAYSNQYELGWTGEFDAEVRFDTDDLVVLLENAEIGNIPEIPIVELR